MTVEKQAKKKKTEIVKRFMEIIYQFIFFKLGLHRYASL